MHHRKPASCLVVVGDFKIYLDEQSLLMFQSGMGGVHSFYCFDGDIIVGLIVVDTLYSTCQDHSVGSPFVQVRSPRQHIILIPSYKLGCGYIGQKRKVSFQIFISLMLGQSWMRSFFNSSSFLADLVIIVVSGIKGID